MKVCYGNEMCCVVEEQDWVAEEQALVGYRGEGRRRRATLCAGDKGSLLELDFLFLTEVRLTCANIRPVPVLSLFGCFFLQSAVTSCLPRRVEEQVVVGMR